MEKWRNREILTNALHGCAYSSELLFTYQPALKGPNAIGPFSKEFIASVKVKEKVHPVIRHEDSEGSR